jgi:alanine racemase
MNLRTWTEIDLQRLRGNIRALLAFTGVKVLVVVKANAYGHGAIETAKAAISAGAEIVGVGDPEEALALRGSGFRGPVLLLGHTPSSYLPALISEGVTFSFWKKEHIDAASQAAVALGRSATLHLYMDLEMGRFGCVPEEAHDLLDYASGLPSVEIAGLMSHLPSIDEDKDLTLEQIQRFDVLAQSIRIHHPGLTVHLSSSAGIPLYRSGYLDMVRAGIVTYGVSEAARLIPGMLPVLAWKATVLDVRTFPAGSSIGYGGEYICTDEEIIAVIGVGYADGFRRTPKNVNEAIWGGDIMPVVGRVGTQHSLMKVPRHRKILEGDTVTLLGESGGVSISAHDIASRWGTNEWDVLSAIGASVKRVYIPVEP